MMKLEVDDKDFQAWANAVEANLANGELKDAVERQLGRIGNAGLRIFTNNTPVKSGNLRKGWEVRKPIYAGGGWNITFVNTREYARYVEYGHRQQPGKYVPAIGKRLKNAWVEGAFYNRKSAEQLQEKIGDIMKPVEKAFNDALGKWVAK